MLRELEIWQEVSIAKSKVLQFKTNHPSMSSRYLRQFASPRAILPLLWELVLEGSLVRVGGLGGGMACTNPLPGVSRIPAQKHIVVRKGTAARPNKMTREKPTMDEHWMQASKWFFKQKHQITWIGPCPQKAAWGWGSTGITMMTQLAPDVHVLGISHLF